ncbi:Hypothetical predicted protein [Olea europaea subsp. europaea]|uniref:Uncharacterized protein n=1 Tax=Olea europaea subsp. europaea TaxID=158383 RepID=A0A8S0TEX1_OLEEU|nr:Hypothetical predicted protein [Olea europaea subsp. europaea]
MAMASSALAEVYVLKKLHKEKTEGLENKGSKEKVLAYNQSKSTFGSGCFSFILFKKVHPNAAPSSCLMAPLHNPIMSSANIGIAELYVIKKMNKEKKMVKRSENKEVKEEVYGATSPSSGSGSGSGSCIGSFFRGYYRIHPAAGVLPLHRPEN